MKKIINEYDYSAFYEVDDLSNFGDNLTLDNFTKINHKKVCFIDEEYYILVVELSKKECFYQYKDNNEVLLLTSGKKFYEINWNGKFLNVLETSADEYEIEMLDKIRKSDVIYFTTQF